MKTVCITLISLLASMQFLLAQEVDFQNTVYYYRDVNDTLISTGATLGQLNLTNADRATHPLFNDGIYLPESDCFANNIWIRIRHIAEDPNGTSVGINISLSQGNPCQSSIMIGGWAGFLYDFEIYQDIIITGTRNYTLGNLYPTSITVASLETLSGTCGSSEWLSFKIMNSSSTGWNLNSTNFTGINPNSNPAFSDTVAVYTTGGCYPPDGFSYVFPTGADSLSAINANSSGYSEFKMSAGSVSHFTYGYEFVGQGGGYQGMSMSFGSVPILSVSIFDVLCYGAANGSIDVNASGIAPFNYSWSNGATTDSLTGLDAGLYSLTVTDQNGCVATSEANIEQPPAINELTQSGNTLTATTADATYQWINCNGFTILTGETNQSYTPANEGDYAVIVTYLGCTDTSDCVTITSADNIELGETVFIYVDENSNEILIQSGQQFNITEVKLYDVVGRLILSDNYKSAGDIHLKVDLTAGVYFVTLKTESGSIKTKILKKS